MHESRERSNGITGLSRSKLNKLEVSQSLVVRKLKFKRGNNSFNANSTGDIFITELQADATARQLAQIGVFDKKQKFVIQMSEETLIDRNKLVPRGAPINGNSIFNISGGKTIYGKFIITRVQE